VRRRAARAPPLTRAARGLRGASTRPRATSAPRSYGRGKGQAGEGISSVCGARAEVIVDRKNILTSPELPLINDYKLIQQSALGT